MPSGARCLSYLDKLILKFKGSLPGGSTIYHRRFDIRALRQHRLSILYSLETLLFPCLLLSSHNTLEQFRQ